jgi:putative membrane protein
MFCGGFGGFGRNGFGLGGPIGSGWIFLAMGFRLLILIGLVILAVKLFKKYTNKPDDTIRIISEKFTKGEISEEEYLRRKLILSQKN